MLQTINEQQSVIDILAKVSHVKIIIVRRPRVSPSSTFGSYWSVYIY